jgi:cob(I)alamin adenosyltransferase
MPSYYSRTGDDGYTGLLGEGRVPKYDPRPEAIGTIDESSAAIGVARAQCLVPESAEVLIKVQRDLYALMAEAAATPENAVHFRKINEQSVHWIEEQTDGLAKRVEVPGDFILPGDTGVGAALDLARTVVRRAERRIADLLHRGVISNPELLRYLNRLSSLLFVLELRENQAAGKGKPTLAKSGSV